MKRNKLEEVRTDIPPFNDEQIEWLETMFCLRQNKDDSNKDIRWKAAQREVVETIKTYQDEMNKGNLRPKVKDPRTRD